LCDRTRYRKRKEALGPLARKLFGDHNRHRKRKEALGTRGGFAATL
jgi:hypothetical protein